MKIKSAASLIPQVPVTGSRIKDCSAEPVHVPDGHHRLPRKTGAGTAPTEDAVRRFSGPVA